MPLLSEILKSFDHINFEGDSSRQIDLVVSLSDEGLNPNEIAWCGDKYLDNLLNISVGTVLLSQKGLDFVSSNHKSPKDINWIIVENPRSSFATLLKDYFVIQKPLGIVASSASIDESVVLNKELIRIGNNVVIEANCEIGTNVSIGHNTVILEGTKIGNNVSIGNNCTIGGVGFGYEMNEKGEYVLIPHIGNVFLEDYVEIGNNVCIDRAVLGYTKLSPNVKVDNLVHIAHGVQIGKNSLVIAKAMVAGSVKIGENVWVAPMSAIMQKVTIGNDSLIGMSSTVLKDVAPSTIVAGSPAKKIRDK